MSPCGPDRKGLERTTHWLSWMKLLFERLIKSPPPPPRELWNLIHVGWAHPHYYRTLVSGITQPFCLTHVGTSLRGLMYWYVWATADRRFIFQGGHSMGWLSQVALPDVVSRIDHQMNCHRFTPDELIFSEMVSVPFSTTLGMCWVCNDTIPLCNGICRLSLLIDW